MTPPVWVLRIINIGGALIKGPPLSGLGMSNDANGSEKAGMNRVGEIHRKNKRENGEKKPRAIQIIRSKDKARIGRVIKIPEYDTEEVISALNSSRKKRKGCNESTPPTEMQATTKEHNRRKRFAISTPPICLRYYNRRRICEHGVIEGDNGLNARMGITRGSG
ncbi:hypothetical protein BJ165DRAFT_1408595 [Panaeolus papilionaceus]|nr:hypothetical protein BJ165DRAFT_1408595 [Panaeolus papilionaceus]